MMFLFSRSSTAFFLLLLNLITLLSTFHQGSHTNSSTATTATLIDFVLARTPFAAFRPQQLPSFQPEQHSRLPNLGTTPEDKTHKECSNWGRRLMDMKDHKRSCGVTGTPLSVHTRTVTRGTACDRLFCDTSVRAIRSFSVYRSTVRLSSKLQRKKHPHNQEHRTVHCRVEWCGNMFSSDMTENDHFTTIHNQIAQEALNDKLAPRHAALCYSGQPERYRYGAFVEPLESNRLLKL